MRDSEDEVKIPELLLAYETARSKRLFMRGVLLSGGLILFIGALFLEHLFSGKNQLLIGSLQVFKWVLVFSLALALAYGCFLLGKLDASAQLKRGLVRPEFWRYLVFLVPACLVAVIPAAFAIISDSDLRLPFFVAIFCAWTIWLSAVLGSLSTFLHRIGHL